MIPNRTSRRLGPIATLAIAVMALGGCAGAAPAESAPRPDADAQPSGAVQGTTAPRTDAEIEALALARADSALHRYTEADARFMTNMIGHHAQALVMARLAPERAASQQVRTLAARIINGQRDEIQRMQEWLRDRGLPVPRVGADGNVTMPAAAGHAGHGMPAGEPHAHMPGMLTPDQIGELEAATGPEFDRLFLTYMIQHHRGAVVMVDELFGTYGAGQDEAVFRLATDINVDQITEIERMQRMLVEVILQGGAG